MTLSTAILASAALTLPCLVGVHILRSYRQRARLSAELANVQASRDACLRSLNIAMQENARLRRGRPLILNGRTYLAYRIMPESIYRN